MERQDCGGWDGHMNPDIGDSQSWVDLTMQKPFKEADIMERIK